MSARSDWREASKRFLVASDLKRSDQPNTPYVKIMGPSVDDVQVVVDAARLLASGRRPDPTQHLCEAIREDEIGFNYGVCTCGYETSPVPDEDLLVDELMAHAVRAALGGSDVLIVDIPEERE